MRIAFPLGHRGQSVVREHEHELTGRLGCQELCVEPEELRVVEIAVRARGRSRVEDDEPETRLKLNE